jgi:hypothetical protein
VLASVAAIGCGSNPTSLKRSEGALDVRRALALPWKAEARSLRPLAATTQSPRAATSTTPIVATDGDVPTDEGALWMIEPQLSGRTRVTELVLQSRRAAPAGSWSVPTVPLPVAAGPAATTIGAPPGTTTPAGAASPTAYDVGRWDPAAGSTDLFTFTPRRGQGVEVRVHTLQRASRVLFQGTIPLAPPRKGLHRDYSIVTWEGSRPDVLVLDRGLDRERLRVSIFSGESGFRRELVNLILPFRKARSADWSVDVGRVSQPRPDLLFFTRDRGRSHAEVHIAAGENNFQRFFYERALDLPAGLPPTYLYAFGVWQGAESFFGVDLREPENAIVQIVPLVQRAGVL